MNYSPGFYFRRFVGLVIALLLSWLITSVADGRSYPVAWTYISLFVLTGLFTFVARGTYMWIVAVWVGAMLLVVFGPRDYPGDRWLGAVIIGVQYLSAVLTGGLLGQWLRYQLARRRGETLPLLPTAHILLVSGLFLLLLPLLAFWMLASVVIQNESLATILMFIPGHTPFLLPALLTGVLCGYWVKQLAADPADRRWAGLLMVLSVMLIIVSLLLRFIFGYLEWHGTLPA
ncbi:hypothetical protein [Thiohalophilus sp.]|uniref:hypothetical protein n=1 Tax=Thiohalophilus sp. TaxID=3028392 RepID=UPI002ACDA8F6|nr:hypothetical protein [Thiohalophilus sp.]MDZ7660987.1 hypothetical protein [Thiohalophilus sp.]